MPKSNAEICREYRKRKRDKKIKIVSEISVKKKNNAKNCQMYRLRKKMLAQGHQSSTNQVTYTPSTPNSPMTFGSSPLLVTTGAVKVPRLKQTAIPSKKLPERKHDIEVSIVENSSSNQHSEQTQENNLTDIVKSISRLKHNAIPNTNFPEGKQDNKVYFVEDSRLNQHPEHSHENDLSNKEKTISRLKQNSLSSKKLPEKKNEVTIVQDSSRIPSGPARLNDLSNVAKKVTCGVGLLSSFKWLNEPSEWCFENNILTLKTENETDFWQGTWYNSFVNTGHVYGVELQDDFTLEVCVEAEFESLNDQAGLMLYVDEKHWLKAGIEYNEDQPMIGSILTNEVSDWATGVFQGDPSKFWLRLTKMGNVVCVKYSTDNIRWNSLRLSTFPICDKYFVGPMSCTPQRGGLIVRFSHLTFSIVQSSRRRVGK